MNIYKKQVMKYELFPSILIRTPLLSFDSLQNNIRNKEEIIENVFVNPVISEAIYLASPILFREMKKEKKKQKDFNRLIYSITRYITRMTTRCTPFGLFAACSMGEIGDVTNILLTSNIQRKTRIDMQFLCLLYEKIIKTSNIKNKIKYFPNTSLYTMGNTYRYINSQYVDTNKKYTIDQVCKSTYLNNILKIAKGDGANIETLSEYLINYGATESDSIEFINELIESQILVGELSQSVIGKDYLSQIMDLLKCYNCQEFLLILKEISELLYELDNKERTATTYKKIIKNVEMTEVPFEEQFLFQVDSIKKTKKCIVGEDVVNELKSTINLLNRVIPVETNNDMMKFKDEFYKRFEEKEILLVEALDPEIGLGYPVKNKNSDISPLVDDLIIPYKKGKNNFNRSQFQSLLIKKAIDCIKEKEKEIVINDTDLKNIKHNEQEMPFTIYSFFQIIQENKENTLINFISAGGSSGANLLSRFAHTDEKIELFLRKITEKEEELKPKDAILVEILHSPEARTGNILYRPHLRKYELLFLSTSDLSKDCLLNISDLTLSIRENKLILRSKKLKKRIIPRLTNAHNYHQINSLPLYRFLCDMQTQDEKNHLQFDWGYHELNFLPRVRYKNSILSPATWFINKEEISFLLKIEGEDKLIHEIKKWREKILMPDYVLMPDGDNELFVDWKNEICVRSLFSIIKKRKSITFSEFLFEQKSAVVKDEKGESFLNECIAVFYKNQK